MAREEQKLRSDSVRQAILNTALEIGLSEGFEAVSIRKIINKMKYSTGVIYHYFNDKQEIIDALEALETQVLSAAIKELLDEEKDSAYNIVTVFKMIMTLALEQPEKYNLIVLHKYSRANPSPPNMISYLSENLKRDIQAGRVKVMDADKAAFSIWSSFIGFILMISRITNLTAEEAERMFNVQSDIILKGVLNHE